jgi:hypothetical protein
VTAVALQAAAQFLLDDWAPDSSDWYDELTGTWHYDPYQQEEDNITALKDIDSADLVQQCLSDAQGEPHFCLNPAGVICCLSQLQLCCGQQWEWLAQGWA